jgi:hypothetical protein
MCDISSGEYRYSDWIARDTATLNGNDRLNYKRMVVDTESFRIDQGIDAGIFYTFSYILSRKGSIRGYFVGSPYLEK